MSKEVSEMPTSVNTQQMSYYRPGKTEFFLFISGVLILFAVKWFELDFYLADIFYNNTHWDYRYNFWTENVMHKGARLATIAVFLALLIYLVKLKVSGKNPQKTYDLFILLLTVIVSVMSISGLKQVFDADCPWDLIRYGGSRTYFSILSYNTSILESKHCFPAAHASVGYGWVALFFYFKVTQNKYKYHALAAALLLGLAFGINQQLRGAHFISHDVTSFLVCLSISFIFYSIAYRRMPSQN